jgi:hypothetical protein
MHRRSISKMFIAALTASVPLSPNCRANARLQYAEAFHE